MSHDTIFAESSSKPWRSYTKAVGTDGFLFVPGQLRADTKGRLVGAGDIRAQTRTVRSIMATTFDAARSSFGKVVKTAAFLTSLDDFTDMNETYASAPQPYFSARSTGGISPLPNGMFSEIGGIAST